MAATQEGRITRPDRIGPEETLPELQAKQEREPYRGETYFDMPPVKHSHYHLKTALSFFSEAFGGGAQVIAAVVDWIGNKEDRSLVRAGRYLALAGSFAAPALLISELYTPKRWSEMLRIFRPTSPMSIGNMSLTAFGLFGGLTAAGQLLEDLGYERSGRITARIFGLPAAATGGMICLYPGTELEETSTPLWASAHPLLSPLFAATGVSIGAAALSLAAQLTAVPDRTRERLGRLAIVSHGVQLFFANLVERAWRSLPSARSFHNSRHARDYRFGILGIGNLFPLAGRIRQEWSRKRSPGVTVAASAAALFGGFLVYRTTIEAGNRSGTYPGDYFEYTQPGELRNEERAVGARPRIGPVAAGISMLAAAALGYYLRRRRQAA